MFKLNVSQLSHHDRPLKSEEENQPFLISTLFLSQSLSKNRDNGLASKSHKPSGRKLLEISISYLTSPDSCELFSKSLITLCCLCVCLWRTHVIMFGCLSFLFFFLPPNGRMSPTLFLSNTQSGWFTTAAPYLHIQPEVVLMTINFWLQAKKKDRPKLFNTTSRIHRGVTTVMKAAI